jgi:DNA-binding NarL/FixJ family response regulator
MARILLADDHEIIRQALRQLLERRSDWEVCGEASDGLGAVELSRRLQPDIAVLDLSMPNLNGVDVILEIRKSSPETRILIFSMHDGVELAREVVAAGAHGYLVKSDGTAHIARAIEALLSQEAYFAPGISALLAAASSDAGAQADHSHQDVLTRR